jgi:hypothetical protein
MIRDFIAIDFETVSRTITTHWPMPKPALQ